MGDAISVSKFTNRESVPEHLHTLFDNPIPESPSFEFNSGEFGDLIIIEKLKEITEITEIEFEYIGALNPFNTKQKAIFRLYIDSDESNSSSDSEFPNKLFYESPAFTIMDGVNSVKISDIDIQLSSDINRILWTVEFLGLSAIEKVGLVLNEKPTIGESKSFYLLKNSISSSPLWEVISYDQLNCNFSLRIIAEKLPPVLLPTQINSGDNQNIKIEFKHSNNSKNWIGIYPLGVVPGASSPLDWYFVNGAKTPGVNVQNGFLSFKTTNFKPGQYNAYFFDRDSYDHIDKVSIVIFDKTPPVINLIGENLITIYEGTSFVDPGISATDNVDGEITNLVLSRSDLDIKKPGEYNIFYSVSDSSGNNASEVKRTIIVKNKIPPFLRLNRIENGLVEITFEGNLQVMNSDQNRWQNLDYSSPITISPSDNIRIYRAIKK